MDRHTAEPTVEEMPSKRAKEWADYHHQFSAPSTYVYDFVWDFTAEAEGPFCTDIDGNVLMDFTSHVAAAPLGYNNPKIMEKFEEFDLVDPTKIAGQDFYAAGGWPPENPELPGPTQLMDRLTDMTSHYDMDTVFLSNSGAEAVENAIKICYAQGGHRAFTFDGAFHGRTLGALSLNRSKVNHRKGYPEVGGVVSVPYPSTEEAYQKDWLTDGPGGNVVADKLDPAQGIIDSEEVAYIILEPVQGEGGYRVPHDGFVEDLAEIRARFDVNVIADEIQAGMGRTGEMWAVDHLDLEPDVITSAKGLRAGATVANSEMFPEEKARLSSTWGAGKIVDSMQGVFTIDAIEEYDLLDNVAERGRQMTELLEDAELPNITDVRGRGLMLAVEFDTKERREAVVEAALKRGLLVLGCGYKTLRLLPPLDVTEREIELGFDVFRAAVEDVA
ncbi:class-III pyridoxal-phosphate-dependent aminotransferase [Halorussus pelagicus]|uniref:class-III pyridoxal-phosphate-dependent aminotransferase n=1 Tax=Halorussus pelagicus TaxID=2505977 RepID=UPI000FFC38DF|nr:aminotransferase class III-fold pyridoxal phosphate-dependent enzyme [Halorussus pelagicus]